MAARISIDDFLKVLNKFRIKGTLIDYKDVKMGHINSTFHLYVKHESGEVKSYIVQRINTYVFKNPYSVMKNIDLVTTFIRNKNKNGTLHFHHIEDGSNYFLDGDNFWRLYTYKVGVVVDNDVNENIMEKCGKAFGEFQRQLGDFDASKLEETIPNFHNTINYCDVMEQAIKQDTYKRVEEVQKEIEYIRSVEPITLKITELAQKGCFPLRTTHNDTKTNNVLLNKMTLEPVTVLDLDTVMLGLMMHDFGDSIRYGANTAKEDETDLSKVKLSMPYFEAYTKGFMSQVKNIATKEEIEYMALGALSMTFECGVRFLTDYINGDKYFRISYSKHNLDRARCQLKLLEDMIAHLDEMNAIVKKYAA